MKGEDVESRNYNATAGVARYKRALRGIVPINFQKPHIVSTWEETVNGLAIRTIHSFVSDVDTI